MELAYILSNPLETDGNFEFILYFFYLIQL